MAGRRSKLDDPEYLALISQSFADGQSRKEMARTFGVNPSTISVWKRDPRVVAATHKIIADRVLEITRKVDGKIQQIISTEDVSLKDLIAVRKEFVGGQMRQQMEKADSETVNQAVEALEENPNLAAELEKLLGGSE